MRNITIVLILLIFLSGCSQSLGNPTARDIIKENGDADIFQWNDGLVYSNASNTVSVQELGLTKGEELGEITSKPVINGCLVMVQLLNYQWEQKYIRQMMMIPIC